MFTWKFLINFCKKGLDEKSIMSKLFFLDSGKKPIGWVRKELTSRETLKLGSGFASLTRCVGNRKKGRFSD